MTESTKKMRVPRVKKDITTIVHEPDSEIPVPTELVRSDTMAKPEPTIKAIKIRKPRAKKGQPMALVDSSDDSSEEVKPQSGSGTEDSPKKKPSNNWIDHVKTFRIDHPDVSYKDALKQAKETYKK